MAKYIFVTGGVVSSLGKGITSATVGRLLKARGLSIAIQKMDPYINVDAGTMNPYQHGEVYVTDDGAETDLDLGHYERFVDINLTRKSNVTTGSIYGAVIQKEREGKFLGGCVQVVPHITQEIKNRITDLAEESKVDVIIVEIGGTVGDIEGLPFLEAIRQFKKDAGVENVIYIHVSLIPHLGVSSELKTKPTQHSVAKLREIGITPDVIVCRSKYPLTPDMKDKIALFCDVDRVDVIEALDTDLIYSIPLIFEKEGLGNTVVKKLGLSCPSPDLCEWEEISHKMKNPRHQVKIAMVGKYIQLKDAYISIEEALKHSAIYHQAKLELKRIDAEEIQDDNVSGLFSDVQGIMIPGGFGSRGIEGKIKAIKFARENNIPFLGLCLGMQCVVIEFARNACGFKNANSSEFDENTPYPVIDLLPEQKSIKDKGGSMRLGSYPCRLDNPSRAYSAYQEDLIYERHRHRYEINNKYRDVMSKKGIKFSGTSPDFRLVEIVEIPSHPFFIATQFHPEFKSRPNRPHPLFRELIGTILKG